MMSVRRGVARTAVASFVAVASRLAVASYVAVASCVAVASLSQSSFAQGAAAQSLPARLTDQEFWKLSTDLSEPGGYFRSENLLSNETGYQMVIPSLLKGDRLNKVYMGVGPEQNFTYIAALKPKMAIIIDIRRGNLLEHLLYKALFEMSANRSEFVARLFGKKVDAKLDTNSTADAIANAYWGVEGDSTVHARNKTAVRELLMNTHKFPLTPEDTAHLTWIYDQFYYYGLPITYSSSGGMGGGANNNMPTYADLMMSLDGQGSNRGYLASEATWRVIKDLHANNLLVPVMGDFGGPKAIRAAAAWLKERNAIVAAFYASNVEQYLWQDGKAYAYYASVAELPTDSASVIIRSGGGGRGGFGGGGGGMRGPNYMCPIKDLVAANKAGRVNMYNDVFSYCTF